MKNFRYKLINLQNQYKNLYPDYEYLPPSFWRYVDNYLFSYKDDPIKRTILTIFEYYRSSNCKISFAELGVSFSMQFILGQTVSTKISLVGASLYLDRYIPTSPSNLYSSTEIPSEILDEFTKVYWPIKKKLF